MKIIESFTIPRTARELQQFIRNQLCCDSFTIPRTARELQPYNPVERLGRRIYHTKNCEETTTMG